MKSLVLAPLFFLAAGTACSGNDGGAGGTGSTTTAITTSNATGSTSAAGTASTSTGTGGNGNGYVPPVVAAACAAPVVTPSATWTGLQFASVKLGWDGQRGAVAYAESKSPGEWDVKVRMLHGDGTIDGAPVSLMKATSTSAPVVSLATRPGALVVCADHVLGLQVDCVGYAGAGQPTAGLSVLIGTGPSVSIGAAGFGVVYGSGIEFHSQLLADDGAPSGADHIVATAQNAGFPNAVTTSNDDGYSALSVNWGSILWRFDNQFQEEEGHTFPGWQNKPTRIAGLGSTIGAVWPDANQVSFRIGDANDVLSTPVKIDDVGASPVYSNVDVTRGKASFAAVWSAFEGHMGYRAIDATGSPLGAPQNVMDLGWDDNPVSIAGVTDGFLVAAAAGSDNGTIKIAHLGCP